MSLPSSPSKKVLADLKASILNPSLTSTYQCWFQPLNSSGELEKWFSDRTAAGLGNYTKAKDEFISLSCSEASLPGSSLATHEINNDYTGVTERHAYRRQYDDRISFTFYVDHDYEIIHYFENWMSFIVNEQRTNSTAFGPGVDNLNYSYRVNFPKDYQVPIYVGKFERDYRESFNLSNLDTAKVIGGSNTGPNEYEYQLAPVPGQFTSRPLVYKFMNAYPISIDSMPVSYDSSQLLKCTVSFTYSRYVITEGGGSTAARVFDGLGGIGVRNPVVR